MPFLLTEPTLRLGSVNNRNASQGQSKPNRTEPTIVGRLSQLTRNPLKKFSLEFGLNQNCTNLGLNEDFTFVYPWASSIEGLLSSSGGKALYHIYKEEWK